MIIWLFISLLGLALVLIVIGLSKPEETAQAMIGFSFLFLLSIVLLGSDVEYKSGEQLDTNYTYADGNLSSTSQSVQYVYSDLPATRNWGLWLAIGSAIGFVGTLFSYGKGRWGMKE